MTRKIHILPKTVYAKIAAGEVVERPASVVKELIENSIDAHATKITIELINAGKKVIIVRDNGEGMSREDCLNAIQKHATSKIASIKDLFHIKSLGFRGEALYSIAAVSKMELVTKEHNALTGTRLKSEGGIITDVEEVGAVTGTTVTVKDLFYNIPARRKFLKSSIAEMHQIYDVIFKYALSYPNIAFKLKTEQKVMINAPSVPTLMKRLEYLYSVKDVKNLVPVEFHKGEIHITGATSLPALSRKTNQHVTIIVNGRVVRDALITSAIINGYGSLLFRNLYPVTILNITVPFDQVDVNIHPSKTQVKFTDERTITKTVSDAITHALKAKDLAPHVNISTPSTLAATTPIKPIYMQKVFETEPMKKHKKLEEFVPKNLKITPLGQIDNTYIIASFKEHMLILDQHAVDERIRTERFMKDIKEHRVQVIVTPTPVFLDSMELEVLSTYRAMFVEMGFSFEIIGKTEIMLHKIPSVLAKKDAIAALKEAIQALLHEKAPTNIDDIRKKIYILMACKGAIKAHQKLSMKEMGDLIYQLMQCDNPYTCPHGRPTMITVENKELEKMFKRKL